MTTTTIAFVTPDDIRELVKDEALWKLLQRVVHLSEQVDELRASVEILQEKVSQSATGSISSNASRTS